MTDRDVNDLDHFVEAQDRDGAIERALAELHEGLKVTHWMWFVFPQLAGLGHSAMAQRFGLSGLGEARAYLAHPVLGPRLLSCCRALLSHHDRTALQVFGSTDAMKLRSSMTLFRVAEPDQPLFEQVLEHYFGGRADDRTEELLDRS